MKTQLERLAAVLLVIMFLTTLYQVVARVVLGISSVWSEELARFIYVCLVFVGIVPLVKTDEHIRVAVVTDRVGRRTAAILGSITSLLTIPFIAVMTWGAWTNTWLNWQTRAPTLEWLRIGYIYLMIWVAGVFMLWYLLANLLRQVRAIQTLPPTSEGGRS